MNAAELLETALLSFDDEQLADAVRSVPDDHLAEIARESPELRRYIVMRVADQLSHATPAPTAPAKKRHKKAKRKKRATRASSSDCREAVLEAVRDTDGLGFGAVMAATGLSRSTVAKHLRDLQDDDLVTKEGNGRGALYTA